ncbi:6560_t:CDS:2 [Gigaspora margarita]|uniref:6560_t:CDS:1 n=1 Tax=Gigaspora margarita TaxID=4874 RepID=A0ABM8VYL5_GIGMA|nr:6560_t:CDS:2 [Gigaspora margarita]
MSAKLKDEYGRLYKTGVRAYEINNYITSYNCFSSIASSDSKFKYNAKFYLAKQYENGLGMSKSCSDAFDLYSEVSNNISKFKYDAKIWLASYFDSKKDHQKAFEFYLDIYYGKPQNIRGIELLLAERVEKGLGDFKDDEKAFNFYSYLYKAAVHFKALEALMEAGALIIHDLNEFIQYIKILTLFSILSWL